MMLKAWLILLTFSCLFLNARNLEAAASDEERILAVAQTMEAAFKKIEDYTCDVEQVFYREGSEDQRYLFKYYFKKEKKIRVDFSQPHSGLTIFYQDEDREATIRPFRSLASLKFRLSVDNPLLKTLAGQRINQTDMGYFIQFILRNLRSVKQRENDFREDEEHVAFVLWALDYIVGKSLEKYQISISKKHWLPVRIERYNLEDKPLEVTDIKNYVLNSHLEENIFQP
jgi:outer membrane lipoprotein-sorting protein